MRKIALLMDGWRCYFTYAWPAGIRRRISETGEDINLYIFNSAGNWSRDWRYNIGEYNIYNLPDLSDFDGIILDISNVSSADVQKEVLERAGKAGVPVLSLVNELDGTYYVGIDNYLAMREVIAHLHRQHGCSRFWCIMGPENNYESSCRARAVKDYMTEHGIAFQEKDFYYGQFGCQSGVAGFNKLFKEHNGLPDAVICANDNIAVGVCRAAEEQGYRVPKDFCVTGFDNFEKAEYYSPSITTVGYVREEAASFCVDIFRKLWAGEEVPRFNYTASKLVCQESCGCPDGARSNIRSYLKEKLLYGMESNEFEAEVLALESEMAQCNTIEEMMYCIPMYIPAMKCDAMYLVLDEHINAYKEESEKLGRELIVSDDGFYEKGYPEKMQVRFAYEKDKRMALGHTEHTEIRGIFPMFDCQEPGQDFLFLPVHFNERALGYFVIKNGVYLMERQYLFKIVNALTTAMANLHKKEIVEYMNRKLSSLYILDPLTGMYNRMGYQKLGEGYFQLMSKNRQKVLILFIDLDRLKYINDNFGHEYGDFAICATAKVITKYSDMDAVPSRTGGDEFILIQSYSDEKKAEEMIHNMRTTLIAEAEAMNYPFELSISVGSVVTDPTSPMTLADYVKLADHRMYEEKLRKKVNRK